MRERDFIDCAHCGLQRLCFPGRVAAEDRQRLNVLSIRHGCLAPGEWLYRPGERVRSLYTLRSGCIKEVGLAAGGNEPVLNFCLPGEVLGLQHAGAECFSSGSIAVENTCYCEVPWQAFRRLCAQSPQVGSELVSLVARAAQASQELIGLLRGRDAFKQLSGFLLNLSSRLRARGLQALEFKLGMSRADIADYLGLTSETVSRCFSELARRGLISVRAKRVQLLQLAELQRVFIGEADGGYLAVNQS